MTEVRIEHDEKSRLPLRMSRRLPVTLRSWDLMIDSTEERKLLRLRSTQETKELFYVWGRCSCKVGERMGGRGHLPQDLIADLHFPPQTSFLLLILSDKALP